VTPFGCTTAQLKNAFLLLFTSSKYHAVFCKLSYAGFMSESNSNQGGGAQQNINWINGKHCFLY